MDPNRFVAGDNNSTIDFEDRLIQEYDWIDYIFYNRYVRIFRLLFIPETILQQQDWIANLVISIRSENLLPYGTDFGKLESNKIAEDVSFIKDPIARNLAEGFITYITGLNVYFNIFTDISIFLESFHYFPPDFLQTILVIYRRYIEELKDLSNPEYGKSSPVLMITSKVLTGFSNKTLPLDIRLRRLYLQFYDNVIPALKRQEKKSFFRLFVGVLDIFKIESLETYSNVVKIYSNTWLVHIIPIL